MKEKREREKADTLVSMHDKIGFRSKVGKALDRRRNVKKGSETQPVINSAYQELCLKREKAFKAGRN